jgi:NADH:ubiquinone oxidoreductase subunit 4 (subunit M)
MSARDLWVSGAVLAITGLVLWAPAIARRAVAADARGLLAISLTLVAATLLPTALPVFAALAIATVLQAGQLGAIVDTRARRAAQLALVVSALLALVTGVALQVGAGELAFVASVAAVAVRVGLVPLHAGTAALCDHAAHRQTEQLAVTVLLVLAHLRFVDGTPFAFDAAPAIVRYGAAMTLVPGLLALVQRDLRGFFRAASMMHGGMVIAALGASGRGHAAAALMVAITTALALGGLGLMVSALEARTGPALIAGPGGRVQALPRLAAAFALFGAAGVAMPGTAGFIADDLMLHALWGESVAATVMIILGAATLAVGTLRTYAGVFLGPAVPSLAPDLLRRERIVVTALISLLLLLGVVPGYLLTPADAMLSTPDLQ